MGLLVQQALFWCEFRFLKFLTFFKLPFTTKYYASLVSPLYVILANMHPLQKLYQVLFAVNESPPTFAPLVPSFRYFNSYRNIGPKVKIFQLFEKYWSQALDISSVWEILAITGKAGVHLSQQSPDASDGRGRNLTSFWLIENMLFVIAWL